MSRKKNKNTAQRSSKGISKPLPEGHKAKAVPHGRDRWVIVDEETGEILDDAQGYGYKSPQKAHAGFAYKNRTPEQKAKAADTKQAIAKFCREHKNVERDIEDMAFYAWKDSCGHESIKASDVREYLERTGHTDLPFTPNQLLKYCLS